MTKEFKTFNDAFDFCREVNYPIVVRIQAERWKLYPSGKAEQKQNPPNKGRLGKTNNPKLLVETAKDIIRLESDPVKLVASLIEYQRLSVKIYQENLKRK